MPPSPAPLANEPFDGQQPTAFLTDSPPSFAALLPTIRRHLHRHPEVGFQEHATSQYIREVLEQHGLTVHGPIAGTGLYVNIEGNARGPHPKKCVGYRADIDALPTQDAKQVAYASRVPGVAHLCGHDGHTAVGIGVALLVHRLRDDFSGTVRVFFQPNEEGTPSGAPLMIQDGILDGLEAVYAIHVDPTLAAGSFGLRYGTCTASSDCFRLRVLGPATGHSARPHEAVDTIWVATQIATALYQLVGRVTDARHDSVLTICQFHAGDAYNVIPAEVAFGGTLRSTNHGDRDFLGEMIKRVAEETGSRYGAQVVATVDRGSPPVVNNLRLIQHVESVAQEAFGPQGIYEIPQPSMGAEDFAHYLEHIPGALIRVGTASGPETSHPLHHALFDLDESALVTASQLMARVVLEHLQKNILQG